MSERPYTEAQLRFIKVKKKEFTEKDFDFLRRMFAERFWFVRIKDESRMQLSPEDYRYDVSLKGAFVRQVLAADLSEEEKERIIRSGLQALRGEEIGE